MQVYFKRTAFIDGIRYRKGLQDYAGDPEKLPSEALVNGKPVRELKPADVKRAEAQAAKDQKAADKAAAKEAEENLDSIVGPDGTVIGKVNEAEVAAQAAAAEAPKSEPKAPEPPPAKPLDGPFDAKKK